jgi:transcriptional/translational regulatory protein YebC/TACO1
VTLPANEAARVIKLYEALEDNADVQAVYTNLDLNDAALAAVS